MMMSSEAKTSQAKTSHAAHTITEDPRWARLIARDKSADGLFCYSVATTGVYCRPSCAARTPNPKNVRFHAGPTEAKAAGFRPCKRCNPDGLSGEALNAELIVKACRMIEEAVTPPALAELAEAVELSPAYFHRLFKKVTGVTPKDYADARRADKMRAELERAPTVTEAIYDAGFNSSGRFYAQSTQRLGMTPGNWRAGGAREALRFAVGQCSLGAILVASSDKGVAAILIGDDPEPLVEELQRRFPRAELVGGDADYEALVAKVVGLVETPRAACDLPLDIRGTAFQQRVWQALREVPAGTTATYKDIAARIGLPAAVRAVAGACGANHLAVAIPCHRIVRSDGGLSGYRWGVERKRALIEREAKE